MPSGGDWEKLARRCVVRAMSHEDAEQYFSEPVDPVADGLPDYLDVIDQPMDLGTVLEKLDNRKYRSAMALLADVSRVWSNCRTYNHPAHPVNAACDTVEKYFRDTWSKNGLAQYGRPTVLGPYYDPHAPDDEDFGEGAAEREEGAGGGGRAVAGAREEDRDDDGGEEDEEDDGDDDDGGDDDDYASPGRPAKHRGGGGGSRARPSGGTRGSIKWRPFFVKALDATMAHEDAEPFNTPVPVEELGLTDYYDVVARPIDLGTIRQRLSKHRHKDVPAALADVERVWANCRLYNNEDDEIVEMCAAVEEEWNARWAEQLAAMEALGGTIPGLSKRSKSGGAAAKKRKRDSERKRHRRMRPPAELLAAAAAAEPLDPRAPDAVRPEAMFARAQWTMPPRAMPRALAAAARFAFAGAGARGRVGA